jgi:hypothetical protein
MMLVEDICNAALARCAEFNARVPSTRSVMARRINARQQQLFSHIADQEPEYFGRTEEVILAANGYDLSLLSPQAERVTHVEIADEGTSTYTAGDKVSVVPIMDQGTELPPRCTIRDFLLEGVTDAPSGVNDLDGVTSLTVHHSKRAATIDDTAQTSEMPDQFDELLVIDLAKHLMRKAPGVDADLRKLALSSFEAEEEELMGDLDRHLEHWRYAETARHGHSQRAQPRPSR